MADVTGFEQVQVPGKLDDVIKMLSEKKYASHPGLKAAFTSLKAGRSSRNAYILLIGTTGAGKSSTINLLFDNPNITDVGGASSTTTDIHEFRIPVPINEIGVANSELRVIDTPGLEDTRGPLQDAKFLATLDAYLADHEELKDKIPNVVMIFHKFTDNRYRGEGSALVKMLRGLDSFRDRITDASYSNVIFVLTHFCSETKATQKQPEVRLGDYKSVIEEYSLYPKPITISIAENKAEDWELPIVNGYYELPNKEYYPKNLFSKLELVTEKGKDQIGLGVFRTAFRDSKDFTVSAHAFKLREESPKIDHYLHIISHAFFNIDNTEISQLLQATWDGKLEANLKNNFPGSLPYLQKALSLRNVNTMEDIPKTTISILELLTSIKHDDATRILLKEALNIQTPNFPQNTIAGQSYNVFKDCALPTSPFNLEALRGSDIGFMIPQVLTSKLDPSEVQIFQLFQKKEEYINFRLNSLGIEGKIESKIFQGGVKPGHNIAEVSFGMEGCVLSATREVRVFQFMLNDKTELTPEFVNIVKKLPPFNQSDPENYQQWKGFFDNYGTHVVKSVHGGGVIQIQLNSNTKFDSKLVQALNDLIQFAEDMSFIVVGSEEETEETESGAGVKTVIPAGVTHSLKFLGGDQAYHTNDLTKMSVENASKLLTNWKKSLKFNPAMLTTEMRLVPISRIVKELGQNISAEIEKATALLFNSELKYVKPEPVVDKEARAKTERMDEALKKQADARLAMDQLTLELRKMELEIQKRDQELRSTEIKHEKDMQAMENQHQLDLQKMSQQFELEKSRLRDESDKRAETANLALKKQELEFELKKQVMRNEEAARVRAYEEANSGCLIKDTRILMADGTEKTVEMLKVGDFVMDVRMEPAKVLGISVEYLLGQKFFGFREGEFFFTNAHIFAGPGKPGNESELSFYVKDTETLFNFNPLMKYMNVTDIGEDTLLFHTKNCGIEAMPVSVFEDPRSYPKDTKIYDIQVDSPTGTYIANGYVARHEIPPVELWPNTMALLFKLMETEEFGKLATLKYDATTFSVMYEMARGITDIVKGYLEKEVKSRWGKKRLEMEGSRKGGDHAVMSLDTVDVIKCLGTVFGNPSASALGVCIYGTVGSLMAPYLDSAVDGNDNEIGENLGKVQHEIFYLILEELNRARFEKQFSE